MKGLKLSVILGVVFLTTNVSALKLKIVKKSASVGHSIVDQADLDSNNTETSLRDKFDKYASDDNSFDSIVEKKTTIKRSTATYKKAPKKIIKKEVEPLIEENDISEHLPADNNVSAERTVREMKKSIQDEFEDEISMEEEIEEQSSLHSASTGY